MISRVHRADEFKAKCGAQVCLMAAPTLAPFPLYIHLKMCGSDKVEWSTYPKYIKCLAAPKRERSSLSQPLLPRVRAQMLIFLH